MLITATIVTTAKHIFKIRCEQTDTQADIVTSRAAFAAKNSKHQVQMQNITTECSNIIYYNKSNNNHKLTTA